VNNTAISIILALLLAGCATPSERMVLLPGPDGKVGKIAVTSSTGATVVNNAYAEAAVDTRGKITNRPVDAATVQHDFATTLSALPPRPISYTLYFQLDSAQLMPESQQQATSILAEIAARSVADIIVIGHTDTMGEISYNDELSLQRANALREALVEQGGDANRISVAGRGEREPLVPTPDETPEPKNRRAEISVR
jgi:outer membrane protein OmpA-like peptidoglycan-associated protein